MTNKSDAAGIVDRLQHEYQTSVEALRSALKQFLAGGPPPDPSVRQSGAYTYPELRLTWPPGQPFPRIGRAFARIGQPGDYAITVTRPDLFRDYLIEQLTLLRQDFKVEIDVGRSRQEIPFPWRAAGRTGGHRLPNRPHPTTSWPPATRSPTAPGPSRPPRRCRCSTASG